MNGKGEGIMIIKKDFDQAICGHKLCEYFTLENKTQVSKTFDVAPRRMSASSQSRVFVQPEKAVVQPERSARFALTYLPYVEGVLDNCSYDVLEGEKVVARLHVHAQSVGPSVNVSACNLTFICSGEVYQTTKVVEFLNSSKCSTKYCFDVDEDSRTFCVSPRTGTLPPEVKLHLKFTFNPQEPGLYHKRMFCLLQFHAPLVFNLSGVAKPRWTAPPKNISFNYPCKETYASLYESYMRNLNQEKLAEKEKRPLSPKFSINLEPSPCEKEEYVMEESLPSEDLASEHWDCLSIDVALTTLYIDVSNWGEVKNATALVNLSKTQRYSFKWNSDPRGWFRIEPSSGEVQPKERAKFDVYFTPSTPDLLYHVELDVRVFLRREVPVSLPSIDLPFTLSFRVIGNSFPDGSSLWIPQCKVVPENLHLPSCEPDKIVYGTFMIERRGHLPVNFIVVLPTNSNYLIQPLLGHFSGDFQLFVVQFNSKSKKNGLYKEEVKIVYDNAGANFDVLELVTSVETPQLILGDNNSYTFDPTFPGCRSWSKIPIENPTSLYVRYEFTVPTELDWVDIDNPRGNLEPMSFGEVDVVFRPTTPTQYSGYLPCFVPESSESARKFTLQVNGSCQCGYLVATPSFNNFGDCIIGKTKSLKIHLFNFSFAVVNFRLQITSIMFPANQEEKTARVTPIRGTVFGKSSMEIDVKVTPHDKILYSYAISYNLLQDNTEGARLCGKPRTVFTFTFKGVLPVFQVVDLNLNGGGPLFSPHWLWKMLAIDKLNKALASLSPESEVDIRFPEAVLGREHLTIALLVQSNKYGPISAHVKKKTFCSCTETSEGNSCPSTDCQHSEVLKLTPLHLKLGPLEKKIMEFTVSYSTLEDCATQWVIHLPHNRKITLNAYVTALATQGPSATSMYLAPIVRLKPVFVGDTAPPLQMFWLYNNTHYPATYAMGNLTSGEAADFNCVNEAGVLPPFSTAPLLFLFKPIETKLYKATFDFCVQDNKVIPLHVEGKGISIPYSDLDLEKTVPQQPILYNSNVSLECSVNIVNVKFVRTFSKVKKLFFLRNRSQNHTWSYHWHNFQVDKLVSVRVVPEKGLVEPRGEVPLMLVLHSFSHPTSISCSVPCDIINYSTLKSYKSALQKRDRVLQEFNDYFTITEKGMSSETPFIPIPGKPEVNHLFVTVNANIISKMNEDQRLSLGEQLSMNSGKEIERQDRSEPVIDLQMLSLTQELLEKMLWKTVNSNICREKVTSLKGTDDCNYFEILPMTKKETENIYERRVLLASKNYIQECLQNILQSIVLKNFRNQTPMPQNTENLF